MAAPKQIPETFLQIKRTIAAPREKVYQAWTDREKLERWMCRDQPTHEVKYRALDVRPGGRYQIEVKAPGGDVHLGEGEYREVKPPEKLVFTWGWRKLAGKPEDLNAPEYTLVTVEFFERGKSTEVVLTHEYLPNERSRQEHEAGWIGCFDVLENHLKHSG